MRLGDQHVPSEREQDSDRQRPERGQEPVPAPAAPPLSWLLPPAHRIAPSHGQGVYPDQPAGESCPGNNSATCRGYPAMSRSSSSVSGLPVADAHSWTRENARSSVPSASSMPSPSMTCLNPALPPYSPVSTTRPSRANQSAGNGPSSLSS